MPDNLPEYAREFWPDLSEWPTTDEVKRFVRSTRRHPDARLAVLSGLRRFSAVDLSVPWAFFGIFVPVVLASVGTAIEQPLITFVLVAASVVAIIIVMGIFADMSGDIDERRRSALAWLRAFEDALPPARRTR